MLTGVERFVDLSTLRQVARALTADTNSREVLRTLCDAERAGTLYDTSRQGNSNAGHLYGTALSPQDKRALIEYLATPEAAQIWAERGGFSSPHKDIDTGVYPDEITQTTAGALSEAEVFRFDLSDLQPAAFGGTVGQGLFKLFQDFVKNPDDVDGIAQQMEEAAAAAFG